ncbi:MAG: diaminopimelate decarboxylase family protein [Traorella sp.]
MKENQINEILKKYPTPIYVFDIFTLKERIQYLKKHLGKDIHLCYAMKANPFLVSMVINDVERVEVCSYGEFKICLENQIDTKKIVFSGVNKSTSMIHEMMSSYDIGIYTVESMTQFYLLKQESIINHKPIQLLLRLTSGNQFGLGEEEIMQIISNQNDDPYIHIIGIQYYSQTQKSSIKKLKKELEMIDTFLEKLKIELNFDCQEFELGPGFPINYFAHEQFDEEAYLSDFINMIDQMKYKHQIHIELGRSICASCGSYLTKVIDKKRNHHQNYAIVDGGIHHLIYYGQSMAMKQPIFNIYPTKDEEKNERWNICGSLCTSNDILMKQISLSSLEIGDIIEFKNTGSYCFYEGMSLFLSRDLPIILFIDENQKIECVRGLTPTYPLNMKKGN